MVTPALKAHFKSAGVQIIPRDEGAEIVASILTSSEQINVLLVTGCHRLYCLRAKTLVAYGRKR